MVLSVSFSFVLYRIYDAEMDRGLRQPPAVIKLANGTVFDYDQFRQTRLDESEHRLQTSLVLFNLAVLIIGGGLSYALALYTLKPIEEALEAQTRFAADASHELRTPLAAMETEIEVALRAKGLSKTDARSLLESNLEEVIKLKTLSQNLLQLARLDDSQNNLKPTALGPAIKEAATQAKKTAKAKHVTVEALPTKLKVIGNHESLVQLLNILLDNAIKYGPGGSLVRVSASKHGKQVELSVTDQGQGIKKQDLPHIFERFYRGDPSRTKQSANGYGLGLPIAQKIAQRHHSGITVKSTIGKGSTFSVSLPLA
jgi:signal transduction histidine kinase